MEQLLRFKRICTTTYHYYPNIKDTGKLVASSRILLSRMTIWILNVLIQFLVKMN